MKKMLLLALLALGINYGHLFAQQVPPSLINTKKAINASMQLAESDPMLIITVRTGRQQLIPPDTLAKVLNFLEQSCVGEASIHHNIKNFYQINGIKNDHHSKLIIFQEMFFSRTAPLENSDKNAIFHEITKLSAKFKHSVFFTNFLFKEERSTTYEQLHNDFTVMDLKKNKHVRSGFYEMCIEETAYTACEGIIKKFPKNNTIVKHGYLINATYGILKGVPIIEYKKSTYCSESDTNIAKGMLYEFGDDITHELNKNSVSDSIVKNTIIEICYDLFCGIRVKYAWKYDKIIYNPNNIHIIQSNTINPYDDGTHNSDRPFDKNMQNLPLNTGIIHSDPDVYKKPSTTQDYESLFFVEQEHSRIVNSMSSCTKQQFHANIDGNIYIITFYIIK